MKRGGLLLGAMLMAGCGWTWPLPPAARHSDALDRSAHMLRQLDRVEADLHTINSEEATFSELVRRHGRAQEVACRVTDEHLQEIHRLAMAQEHKKQEKARRRHALAQLHRRSRSFTR